MRNIIAEYVESLGLAKYDVRVDVSLSAVMSVKDLANEKNIIFVFKELHQFSF